MIADRLKLRRRAMNSGDGCDVDDFPSPGGDHDLADGLRKQKRAGEIGFDDLVPVLQFHIFHGRAPGRTGVVDEYIDALLCRGDLGRRSPHLLEQRHISVVDGVDEAGTKLVEPFQSSLTPLSISRHLYNSGAHSSEVFRRNLA